MQNCMIESLFDLNSPADIFSIKEVMDEIISEIKSDNLVAVLPPEFMKFVLGNLSVKKDGSRSEKFSAYRIIMELPQKSGRQVKLQKSIKLP